VKKYICFRFDIDTHICLKEGVPNLLEIFEAQDARCTFFVSMGKAFKRSYFISEKLNKAENSKKDSKRESFSMPYKLGFFNSIFSMLLNPMIGAKYHKTLNKVIKKGNELGLHGGRNHATWERDSYKWTEKQLHNEIEYGLKQFEIKNLPKPISFASPCWKSPEKLDEILEKLNFKIVANQNTTYNYLQKDNKNISQFPTNVIGENREIGFIENLRALDYSTEDILLKFSDQLDNEERFKMVFDHPFYAGRHELEMVAAMIRIAKEKGYIVDSLKNIYQNLNNESTAHLS
jgi:peptidoglycan/xylan/chitin deacetylase (PgdA/CDA1 family)